LRQTLLPFARALAILPLVYSLALAQPVAAGEPLANPAMDFTGQAMALFRVVACGGEAPLPASVDRKAVDHHCARIARQVTKFRARYFEGARPFFTALVPRTAPRVVVYPFGGGDLISALVAFPDASEITTISLEMAGDPRRIDQLNQVRLRDSLKALRAEIGGLLSVGSNTSANLSSSQRNDLPAQVSSFLLGLAAGGYEPVSMKYFTLTDEGNVRYMSIADLVAAEQEQRTRRTKKTRSLKYDWLSPNFSEAFSNVEITYRRVGERELRVHRHIAWNLSDSYLNDHPALLRHLEAKGKVTLLTKGASYLLWMRAFSRIRDYMLANLAWMLSDSTGIPPAYARKAGLVQETYGKFSGPFLPLNDKHAQRHAEQFRELWQKNRRRSLKFRFGYVDANKQAHLLVTRPRSQGGAFGSP
jgi:hypothetical protein